MSGKAGRMTRIGAYPETLKVDFEPASTLPHGHPFDGDGGLPGHPGRIAGRSFATRVASLGNPASEAVRTALDIAGTIHFTSLAVVGTGEMDADSGQEKGALVLEISGDGSVDEVIDAVTHAIGHRLRPIFKDVCGLPEGSALNDFLRKHNVDDIAILRQQCRTGVFGHARTFGPAHHGRGRTFRSCARHRRAAAHKAPATLAAVLAEARQHVQSLGTFAWAFEPAESLLEKPPGHWGRALMTTLLVPPVFATVAVIWAACWYMTYSVVFGRSIDISSHEISFTAIAVAITSLLLSGLGVLVAAALLVFSCLLALRRLEDKDRPESTSIGISALNAILVKEDHAAQNHLTAISTMKAGILRRLALRFSFYLISIAAQKVFKPGFLNTINTIHFARWMLLPGSNRLMFFSNYGGSWESYLEDFIAKASAGLTGVWSNTVGYPRTRWLFLDGARDGDRFKRWARRQQVPTLFWYSAYPELNTTRIRINSRIRRGIASAVGNEARDWLSLFGSLRRPASETTTVQKTTSLLANISSAFPAPLEQQLETGEIQSIFFGPFGPLGYSHMLAIGVPDKLPAPKRRAWLDFVIEQTSFGEGRPAGRAMMVAFGPGGLRQLGLDEGVDDDPLETFPIAFRHGMGNPERGRILDDRGRDAPGRMGVGVVEEPRGRGHRLLC